MSLIIQRGRLQPFDGTVTGADPYRLIEDGAIALEDGEVIACGPAHDVIRAHSHGTVVPTDALLKPGFVDIHIHYPQTRIIGTYANGLLEWLETVTFPEEMRFEDPAYAAEVAVEFFDQLEEVGTVDATVYCTSHPNSVDALFREAMHRSIRVTAGLVLMDRNAPSALLTPAQDAYDQAKALIERWHGADGGRLRFAITPRFAPTSTPALLEAAATLWEEHPTCAFQTHLSETEEEIAWVRRLFPEAPDYLGVYEGFGLLKPGAIFAHAIHLSDREVAALAEHKAVVAHCPTANQFLNSGRCNVRRLLDAGITVKLGSDVGGGTTFDIMEVARLAEGMPHSPPMG